MSRETKQSAKQPERAFSAKQVRGGETILRTRPRRIIFFGGLAGLFVLVALLRFNGVV